MTRVEVNDVMADQKLRTFGKFVQTTKCVCEIAPAIDECFIEARANGCKRLYPIGLRIDFEIDRDAF
jgi:hypothetical protein